MIGVFDSGSGGLTVLRAIKDRLPSSDVLYFGDIKNAPYGGKNQRELSELTVHALSLLSKREVTSIVSACNSTSASLAVSLFDSFAVPSSRLIEMVGPTVRFLAASEKRVLLCATPATIESGIYQHAFSMAGKSAEYLPVPNLAGLIEFGAPASEIDACIAEAFKTVNARSCDLIVLACTHYPLATPSFRRVLGDDVHLLDPALIVAERVEEALWPREAGEGKLAFLISKESPQFRSFVQTLFPDTPYTLEVLE